VFLSDKFLFALGFLRRVKVDTGRLRVPAVSGRDDPTTGVCGCRDYLMRRRRQDSGGVVDGRRSVERQYTGSADDTAQQQVAVADRRLNRPNEAAWTRDAVTTRERLHRGRGRQADHTLQ